MQARAVASAYNAAMAILVVTVLLLIWLSLGVGIIGRDGDPANALYFGVVAIGVAGAALSRLRARGMAHTLIAMAVAQAAIGGVALAAGLGLPFSGPAEIVLLNGFFSAAFAASAVLFRRAARA